MKCGDCKFWRAISGFAETVEAGECHRRAPAPMSDGLAVLIGAMRDRDACDPVSQGVEPDYGGWAERRALWPATFNDEFCGEFSPKTERQGFV